MASLNLSTNGPSIKSSYQAVINGPAPSSSSPTFAQWALFSVSAPLANAFQDSGSKESVLKVQSTGEGELEELIEDFSEGRIQFAFVKVKDPNSGLPKYALIAWCGGGVPERTKGYFTTHTAAVSKILHGYHVQITARSESDLEPESIVKKIADASGAKYSAGSSGGASSSPAPPVATKPVFTPTSSSNINPIVAARNRRGGNTDDDGWGDDAPPVTRSQLEKVESSYKPTKVNMAELTGQKQEPSRFQPAAQKDEDRRDVVGGGYQPVGKIDIAAIRAASKNQADDRPTTVKGAYEPVGKVDIAAIRAKAQKPPVDAPEPEPEAEGEPERPKSLAERSAAFSQSSSERITSLPKPKVANKFGGGSFSGTKAPTPSGGLGLHGPVSTPVAQVGSAGRSFASSAGKTPAQLWAEKKAKEGGNVPPPAALGAQRSGTDAAPIGIQKSGEWKSGYSGKSWGPVKTGDYGRGIPGQISQDNTGEDQSRSTEAPAAEPASPGGVGALRDRFKNTAPIGFGAPPIPQPSQDEPEPEPQQEQEPEPSPPPPPSNTRPSGGFALPGLPARPPSPTEESEPEPTPPPPPAQRPAEPQQSQSYQQDYDDEPEHSPVRVPVPVARGQETEINPPSPPPAIPTQEIERQIPREEDIPDEPRDAGRDASTALAEQEFGQQQVQAAQAQPGGQAGGKRAIIQYDYEAAEDNEIDLREGDEVTNIDMVDEDWWMGTNAQGRSGLFPSNYVELVKEESAPAGRAMPPPPAPAQAEPTPAPPPAAPAGGQGKTATALFDYEAAEDNELSFNENDKITNIEFPDEDWWFGQFRGKQGLFPANYVELDR